MKGVGKMTKEQLIALGLTEEQADKVLGAVTEEMKGYIPKSRFDEVNNANRDLKQQITDRDKQLEDLKKSAGDNQELQARIQELQKTNEAQGTEFEAKLQQVKVDAAIEVALAGAKAKNVKAVKALLDMDTIKVDGDQVKGLDDQVKKLAEAEDSKFLFGDDGGFKGTKPGESGDKGGKETLTVEQEFEKALTGGF
jgi:hypothetical protein